MNLVLDIGNTLFKICIFKGNNIEHHEHHQLLNNKIISRIFEKYPIKNVIYSDTRGIKKGYIEKIIPNNIKIIELLAETPIPIKNNYQTPQTLGKDRIAGAVAANYAFSGFPILTIDIGTALTIDFISEQGIFEGGIISPGPEMRYIAMHHYTGKLPLLKITESTNLIGTTTQTAIESGVQNGVEFEINQYISNFAEQYNNLKVVLTGGYANIFDKKIKYPIFADDFLVPRGLNRILNYNKTNN